MSTGKRLLGKRSILGTRVSVPVTITGSTIYVPAVIHSTRMLGLETSYCVQFMPGDSELRSLLPARKEYRAEQMVGPGFQNVNQVVDQFCSGQKVFLTFKGREVSGTVVRHDRDSNSVLISIHDRKQTADSNSLLQHDHQSSSSLLSSSAAPVIHVRRRLDEMRLLESRKSARLVDSEIDYSKILTQDTTGSISSSSSSDHHSIHARDSDDTHNVNEYQTDLPHHVTSAHNSTSECITQ